MKLLAKPILENKFWIVEGEDGSKKGTIQQSANGKIKVVLDSTVEEFECFESAMNAFSIETSNSTVASTEDADNSVDGYPTKDSPRNILFDAKQHLPMYTKTEKSCCYYAAGYYIIHFEFGWAQAYCPKVITLKRNEFRGPYKTELEMKEQLRLHNAKN